MESAGPANTPLQFWFVPMIYFFYPETSNISLEDIDKIFMKEEDEEFGSETATQVDDDEEKANREYIEKV